MSVQRSPLKARNNIEPHGTMRKQIGKRQLKRKSSLFGSADFKEPVKKRLFDMYDDSLDSSFGDSCSQNNSLYGFSKQSSSPVKHYVTQLPQDLRLATKLRIISEQPFPFSDSSNNNSAACLTFDSSIIDEGCRLLAQSSLEEIKLPNSKKSCPMSILNSAGLYYQYPDISFMQMYPRLDGISRSKGIRTSLSSFGSDVVDPIQTEWRKSFNHVYSSWKNGKRNSFYVCGPHFTTLFIKNYKPKCNVYETEDTCMGLNDFWEHRVVVTPTTNGFRKLLVEHDIAFSLPLKDGEEIKQENWLRDIGFSPSKIKLTTTDSQDSIVNEDSGNASIASSAESTISIKDSNAIDAFRKLMVDLNLGWAKTGQQAGLPPTIIAINPFMNSALKSLNFKTQVLIKQEGTTYALDVEDGPILPHVPLMLHEFFRSCNNQLDNNNLKVYVNGRSICDGLNEATGEGFKNLNEFSYDGSTSRYFY